jgi:molybdate transport system substrate-binding protein
LRRALLLGLVLVAGCGGGNDQLKVSAASSLSQALPAYRSDVSYSFAGSDQLAAQIRQGAKADVFASADSDYPAELHREGLVGKPVVFARNRLVVVIPKDSSIESLADLSRPGTKIVVGDPSVPVGAYTQELLGRLPDGERDAILANVRSEEPEVTAVLAKVVDGAADAGFVYVTDTQTVAGEVRTVQVPGDLQPDVAYAAAVVGDSGEPELAQRYLQGLLHGDGAADLREAGFLPPP